MKRDLHDLGGRPLHQIKHNSINIDVPVVTIAVVDYQTMVVVPVNQVQVQELEVVD